MTKVHIFPHTICDLQQCIDTILNPVLFSPTEHYDLTLEDVVIARRVQGLLVELLNVRLPSKAPTANALKWRSINIFGCRFAQPSDNSHRTANYCCSLEERNTLATGLAGRPDRLWLLDCREILDCLLFNSPRLFEVKEWHINQHELSGLECARVGDLIQQSVHLKMLWLQANNVQDPLALAQGFANAAHLQIVRLGMKDWYREEEPAQRFTDLLFREGWNGIMGGVLQSRLKELNLWEMYIDDSHFMMIAQMLPTSQLESLFVYGHKIGLQGIVEFGRQLPRIKCLKELHLGYNSRVAKHHEECCEALLQGMLENYSMELFFVSCKDDRIDYLTYLNRVGRRILATSSLVPAGIWPLLLQRAERCRVGMSSAWEFQAPAQCIYFFLQSFPMQSVLTNCTRSHTTTTGGTRTRQGTRDLS